jgi:adenylate cyclase class IV
MPRNVEIKARVKDLDAVKSVAASLSGTGGEIINQRDIFFRVSSGKI